MYYLLYTWNNCTNCRSHMIELEVCEDYIKLKNCEQLDVDKSETYDIYYSEILINEDGIDDVIKLLQDYKNAP